METKPDGTNIPRQGIEIEYQIVPTNHSNISNLPNSYADYKKKNERMGRGQVDTGTSPKWFQKGQKAEV